MKVFEQGKTTRYKDNKPYEYYQIKLFDNHYEFEVFDNQNKLVSVFGKYQERGMFIISACRDNYSDEENERRSKELEKDIRSYGLGYVPTLGGSLEVQNGKTVTIVNELSYIVPYMQGKTVQDMFEIAIILCNKYEQDDVFVMLPTINDGKASWYDKNGNLDRTFKDVHITKGDDYFTSFKKQNGSFSFGDTTYFGKHHFSSWPDGAISTGSGELTDTEFFKYKDTSIKEGMYVKDNNSIYFLTPEEAKDLWNKKLLKEIEYGKSWSLIEEELF